VVLRRLDLMPLVLFLLIQIQLHVTGNNVSDHLSYLHGVGHCFSQLSSPLSNFWTRVFRHFTASEGTRMFVTNNMDIQSFLPLFKSILINARRHTIC